MKFYRNLSLLIFLFITGITPGFCQEKDNKEVLNSLKFLFNSTAADSLTEQMEVDTADAKACIRLYRTGMPAGIKWGTPGYPILTEKIKFKGAKLGEWFDTIRRNQQFSQLKIFIGAYTKSYVDKYFSTLTQPEKDKLYGRLTVFLWPYKNDTTELQKPDGTVQKPFNLGGLEP